MYIYIICVSAHQNPHILPGTCEHVPHIYPDTYIEGIPIYLMRTVSQHMQIFNCAFDASSHYGMHSEILKALDIRALLKSSSYKAFCPTATLFFLQSTCLYQIPQLHCKLCDEIKLKRVTETSQMYGRNLILMSLSSSKLISSLHFCPSICTTLLSLSTFLLLNLSHFPRFSSRNNV